MRGCDPNHTYPQSGCPNSQATRERENQRGRSLVSPSPGLANEAEVCLASQEGNLRCRGGMRWTLRSVRIRKEIDETRRAMQGTVYICFFLLFVVLYSNH